MKIEKKNTFCQSKVYKALVITRAIALFISLSVLMLVCATYLTAKKHYKINYSYAVPVGSKYVG